jgi:hypothetical protein
MEIQTIVADPHLNADPDPGPAFHTSANPDRDQAFHFHADPDLGPTLYECDTNLLHFEPLL